MQMSLPGQLSAFETYSQRAWRQKRKRQLEKGLENVVLLYFVACSPRKGTFSEVHVEMGCRDKRTCFRWTAMSS